MSRNVTSQDFINIYEPFYDRMRLYLWPYNTLKELANVELDIYTAFLNLAKLEADLAKLMSSIKDACKEDEILRDYMTKLTDLAALKNSRIYFRLPKVAEVNPDKCKLLKLDINEEEQE